MSETCPVTTLDAGAHARPRAGIAFVVVAVLLFSLYDAVSKWLTADYSPWQIMLFRGLFGLVPIVAYVLAARGPIELRSGQPVLQLVRAALGLGTNVLFIMAYRDMPLADAVAIGHAAPIFIVLLSVPLLAEPVGLRRASAALVGFLGVLLIVQPGTGLLSSGAPYALGGTLCYALLLISTRRLGLSDSAFCTAACSNVVYVLGCAAIVPRVWVTPDLPDLGLLAATGLLGGTAMLLFAHAYRHGEAALLAPFDYTALLWAGLFGFVVWGDLPGPLVMAGMAVVAGSGMFLLRRERPRPFRPAAP